MLEEVFLAVHDQVAAVLIIAVREDVDIQSRRHQQAAGKAAVDGGVHGRHGSDLQQIHPRIDQAAAQGIVIGGTAGGRRDEDAVAGEFLDKVVADGEVKVGHLGDASPEDDVRQTLKVVGLSVLRTHRRLQQAVALHAVIAGADEIHQLI